jgi:hypothetical protein
MAILVVLGLLSAGLEGARDSVDVLHVGAASGHEEHHSFSGKASPDHPSSPDHPDTDGHSHYCHCGLHVPALFASAIAAPPKLQHVQRVTEPVLKALAHGPPPVPPPIA